MQRRRDAYRDTDNEQHDKRADQPWSGVHLDFSLGFSSRSSSGGGGRLLGFWHASNRTTAADHSYSCTSILNFAWAEVAGAMRLLR